MILMFITIFFIFVLVFSFIFQGNTHTLVKIKSSIDEKFHMVRDLGTDDEKQAADTMAEIKRRLTIIVKHIQNKFKTDPDAKFLNNNFNTNNILETDVTEKDTSYSINKGETISLCLRNKDKENYPIHDLNTLMFVSLHELTHLMTQTFGHDSEFTENFIIVLKEAKNLGLYDPINYNSHSVNYCGMEINKSPLY